MNAPICIAMRAGTGIRIFPNTFSYISSSRRTEYWLSTEKAYSFRPIL